MVEEVKGQAHVEEDADEQFFIDEDQFEDVIPEYGTCGGGDDDQTEDTAAKTGNTCSKGGDCCKNGGNECGVSSDTQNTQVQVEETVVVPEPEEPVMKNPCYKCKEKPAQYKNKSDIICKDCLFWSLTHRFKNAMIRYVRIQKDYPNLVAISGGS